eukprot:460759-Rhodomonas_salina.1
MALQLPYNISQPFSLTAVSCVEALRDPNGDTFLTVENRTGQPHTFPINKYLVCVCGPGFTTRLEVMPVSEFSVDSSFVARESA